MPAYLSAYDINYSFSKHDKIKEEEHKRALIKQGRGVLSPDGAAMSFGHAHTLKFD